MKLKKLISLLAAVTMLSSVMAITPVAQAAGATLNITSEANTAYDRTGYKAYTVTYSISGDDFTTTYNTNYSSDDEMWTISLAGGGLMSLSMKFTPVASVGTDTTVLDRTFALTEDLTSTKKAYIKGFVGPETLIKNFDANTFKNGVIAYAGSPIALHTVEFDEVEGGEGWTSGGTITQSGEATVVKTVWYIAENSGYTIEYVYDEIAMDYGTNDNSTTYYAGKNLDVKINGTTVTKDTAKLTLGTAAPAGTTADAGEGKVVSTGKGKVWNNVVISNVDKGTDYKAKFTDTATNEFVEFPITGITGITDEVKGDATFAVILKTAKNLANITLDILFQDVPVAE